MTMQFRFVHVINTITFIGCFLLLAGSAFAQGASTPPMCIPTVNGYVKGLPVVSESTRYCHVYWLCNNKGGEEGAIEGLSWPKRINGCAPDAVLRTLWPKALAVHSASATVTSAHATWKQDVAFDCYNKAEVVKSNERRAMCVERHARLKANKRTWWPDVKDWVK